MNPFKNTPIRSAWDKNSGKRWFSVVDAVAALTGGDYNQGRNYWKWYKHKLLYQNTSSAEGREMQNPTGHSQTGQAQVVSGTNRLTVFQIKLEANDGKMRFTDVMDASQLTELIQMIPCRKAAAFKQWIARMAAKGEKIIEKIEEAAAGAEDKVRKKAGNMLIEVTTEVWVIFDDTRKMPKPCCFGALFKAGGSVFYEALAS